MALSNASSWIFSMILLNHGIITVSTFPITPLGLVEFGLDLLLQRILNGEEEVHDVSEEDLGAKIDDLKNTIKNSEKKIIAEVDRIIKSNEAMSKIHNALTDINYHSKFFNDDASDLDTKEESLQFARKCVSTNHGSLTHLLHKVMESIKSTVGMRDLPVFESAIEPYLNEEKAAARCGKTISVQQEIYRMYGIISMYLVKGYSMILKAYDVLEKLEGERYAKRRERTEMYENKDLLMLTKVARSAMRKVPRDIRSCDPEFHEEGETYIRLKKLFDTALVLEEHLANETDCSHTCEKYTKTSRNDRSDKALACHGTFYDCHSTPIKSFREAAGSDRRYDAIWTSSVWIGEGPQDRNLPTMFDRWFNWCDGCVCTCDGYDHPNTVRWFSLMPIQSNTEENYVITGLRLVEINSIIYIQIQEGQLQPNGRVLASTVEWQPVIEGSKEYSWRVTYDQKSVNLDTLVAPHLQAMTGIKFDRLDCHLVLSIRAHEFDYSSGVLHDGDGSWISNEITDREEIKIVKVANPLDAEGGNIVASGEETYVNFHMTHWDFDLTQVDVPFIDAQAVVIDPPLPLAGAGLYYRRRNGYGGFIALKLVALDYAEILRYITFLEPVKPPSEANGEGQVDTEDGADAEEDGDEATSDAEAQSSEK